MKPWYRSKTLWGVAVVLVSTAARAMGTDVDSYLQIGLEMSTFLGGIIAFLGRQWASEQISWSK